jgi:hypothetical protein
MNTHYAADAGALAEAFAVIENEQSRARAARRLGRMSAERPTKGEQ